MRALNAANEFVTVSQPDKKSVVVRQDKGRCQGGNLMSADRRGAEKMYKDITAVDQNWLKIRDIVVQKRPKKTLQG